ncbi:putative lipid carrier protein YhbT [Erwinia toletana]|uniref:Ubiquinone biosynthesis accessory factor UbiT n=1 Tax=Winslowiella toletana TaxID=92490 RepID=A0ABS4P728_9GAMM|nr:SCP2 domain-containing protein [Winslowiella toletana]MBP2168449.1 putative lipid carrier protein YhbT [Winslowiella toletana]
MLNQLRAQCVQKGPQLLRFPLQLTPFAIKKRLLQQLLNWQFHHALAEGELNFLEGRWLGVEIRDLDLRWSASVVDGLLAVSDCQQPDVWFRGDANDLLLIAARKRDPDTLFFQRRLVIEGDTELGLEVKNVMDAIELEMMPTPLRIGLIQLAQFVETGLNKDANSTVNRAGASC